MPSNFLSHNVCEGIDIFNSKLPELQKADTVCKVLIDFIQNLDNPKANQEPFKSPKANANLMKYAQESFLQDAIVRIQRNKTEGTPRTVLFIPKVLISQGSTWAVTNGA